MPDPAHTLEAGDPQDAGRRRALTRIGWAGLSLLGLASVPALIRFLRPRGWRDRGEIVELGPLAEYRSTTVSARWVQRHGLWLVRRAGRLFALEARCTHLGCTPRWVGDDAGFLCR
jgi:cytochrome b6-f complex iron-sulfur subunit